MFDDAIQTYTAIKYNKDTKQHIYAFTTYLGHTIQEALENEMIGTSVHTIKDPNLSKEQLTLLAYIDTLEGYGEGCEFLVHVDLDEDFIRVGIEDYIINDFEIPNDENYFLWTRLKQVCKDYTMHTCWLHPYADHIIFKMPYLLDSHDPENEDDPVSIWQGLHGFLNYKENRNIKNTKRRKRPDPAKFKKQLF